MRTNLRMASTLVLVVSLGLPLSACGSSPSATAPAGGYNSKPVTGTAAKLVISGYMFSDLTVKTGATVTVSNEDAVGHTVTVDGQGIDVTVEAGGTATFTAPAKAGSYALTCDFHPSMKGTLTVS